MSVRASLFLALVLVAALAATPTQAGPTPACSPIMNSTWFNATTSSCYYLLRSDFLMSYDSSSITSDGAVLTSNYLTELFPNVWSGFYQQNAAYRPCVSAIASFMCAQGDQKRSAWKEGTKAKCRELYCSLDFAFCLAFCLLSSLVCSLSYLFRKWPDVPVVWQRGRASLQCTPSIHRHSDTSEIRRARRSSTHERLLSIHRCACHLSSIRPGLLLHSSSLVSSFPSHLLCSVVASSPESVRKVSSQQLSILFLRRQYRQLAAQ